MRAIVDLETGEVVHELKDGDRIISQKQIDTIPIKATQGEKFSKMYHQSITLLNDCKLFATDYAIVLYLATNLRYKSNVCKYENGRLITRQGIIKELNLSESSVKRSIRKLITEGILVEVRSTEGLVFIMNPYLFMVGDTINNSIHDLFKNTKWSRGWVK